MKHTLIALVLCLALMASSVWAAEQSITLDPGDGLTVVCSDAQPPTWTAPRAGCPDPPIQAGQPCPQALHDAITAPAPDGREYPTWHPPVDATYGCWYGHEHGDDPTTSLANATLPPFGYIGSLVGDAEPHVGFKCHVVNQGDPIDEFGTPKPSPASIRLCFHFGTSGIGRYTNRLHSGIHDYVGPSGRSLHVQGMFDTGINIGSTCQQPRSGGRDFSTVGCNDPYEIWSLKFQVKWPGESTAIDQSRATAGGAISAFDPITTRDPADNTRLLYTETYRRGASFDPLSPSAQYRGCKRESYTEPRWHNGGRQTVYWTSATGLVDVAAAGRADADNIALNLLRQEVSATPKTTALVIKDSADYCDPTVRAPN